MSTPENDKELYELLDALYWNISRPMYNSADEFVYLVRWLERADSNERTTVRRWLKTIREADDD